jgi:hypothetical protein
MERHGDKQVNITGKAAYLQCGINQTSKNQIQFGFAVFEGENNITQGIVVNTSSCDCVKVNFLASAIRAGIVINPIFADIPAAATTVIGRAYRGKLIPAIRAQGACGFGDIRIAVDAYAGPEQVAEAVSRGVTGSLKPR